MATPPQPRLYYPRPRWAKRLGGTSILVGLFSLSCMMPAGCVQNRFLNPYYDVVEQVFPNWYYCYMIAAAVASLVGAALLIGAGGLLMTCHPATLRLHLLYAYVLIGLSVLNALVTPVGLAFVPLTYSCYVSLSISACLGLVFGSVYPCYVLVRFSRSAVKQDVASWAEARRQGKKPGL